MCRTTSPTGCWRCWPARWPSCAIGDPALLATDVGPVIDGEAAAGAGAPCRADGARGPADLPMPPAAGHRARHLLRAARLRDRQRRRGSSARCSARSCMSCAGSADRLDAVLDEIAATGYGADPRHPQPHRRDRAPHPRAARRRQQLRQPQHDRRGRRRAAVRRRSACRAPAPRPAARATSTASPPSARSRPTPPPPAATPPCCRSTDER